MNKNFLSLLKRSVILFGFVFAAIWVVYSAQGYDAYPFSYIPFAMSGISAMLFLFTGAAFFADSSEADE
jgi:hypothetical protein